MWIAIAAARKGEKTFSQVRPGLLPRLNMRESLNQAVDGMWMGLAWHYAPTKQGQNYPQLSTSWPGYPQFLTCYPQRLPLGDMDQIWYTFLITIL